MATGQMQGQLNGASFTTYCTDVFESVYLNQDLILVSAVPEPSTYGLMLAGLAAMGFIARRRG